MEKFRINAQDYIIENMIEQLVESLENSIIGKGIAKSWDYELIDKCTIEFTLKEGEEIKPADLVWFGYITAID